MNDVFLKFTEIGMQASILILAVMILRKILRRTPRWMVCLLWGVVALRLSCPIQVESPLSLQPAWDIRGIMANMDEKLSAKEGMEMGAFSDWMEDMNNKADDVSIFETDDASDHMENPSQEGEDSSPQMEKEKDQPNRTKLLVGERNQTVMDWVRDNWVLTLWLLGTCLMLCHAVVCLWPLRWSLRFAVRKYDATLGTYFYESDMIVDPFVLGIARPKIYLPVGLGDHAREHILRHELAHVARGDYAWKPLGFLLLSVYWYFPLCWAGYYLFCRDMELACDEKVIRSMSRESRAEYCQVLLQMCAKRRGILASPVAFGEVGAGYRIRAILDYRMPKLQNLVASILLGTMTCACLLTSPEGSVSGDKSIDGIIGRLTNLEGSVGNEKRIDGIIGFLTNLKGSEQKNVDVAEGLSSEGTAELRDGEEASVKMPQLGENIEVHHFLEYDAQFMEIPMDPNSSCGFYCSCLHDEAIYFYDERNGEKAIWRRGLADGEEEVYLSLGRRESWPSAMCFTKEGNLMVIMRANEGQGTGGSMLREYDEKREILLEMPIKSASENCVFFGVAQSTQGRTFLRMSVLDSPENALMELLEDGSLLKTETPNMEYVNGIGNTTAEGRILLCDPRGITLFDGKETEELLQWTEVGVIAHDVVAVCMKEDEIQILTMDQNGQNAEIVLLRERR